MSKTPSQSPERHTFQRDAYVARREDEGQDVSDEYIAMLEQIRLQDKLKWEDPDRTKNNMEYDLVTTDWILSKARVSEAYAQNLYAALCNNDFQRNDVWPLLSDQKWHCSWRYAGGIIADMRQEGDYIDWYCSGINNNDGSSTNPEYKKFVVEGIVTDQIREDLFRLGWLIIADADDKLL